jgi:hypothetical protein
MKSYFKNFLLISCAIPLLAGCTRLNVTKISDHATNQSAGIRYSLPKPYIQVTPQGDGSVVADIVYLPDPENSYVIDGKSYLAFHSLNISTEEGLLKKIVWTGDSSAVFAQGVSSGAAVAEKNIASDAKSAAERDTKVESAQKAVDEAQLAVDMAASDLELLVANNASADAILKAKVALNEAQLKLAAARKKVNVAAGNARADSPEMKERTKNAGPVLFAINERLNSSGSPTVVLVAAKQNSQDQPSYVADPPFRPAPDGPKDIELFPKGMEGLRPDKDGNMQLLIIANSPISEVDRTASVLELKGAGKKQLPPISIETPTTIRVALSGTPPGEYTLTLAFKIPKKPATYFSTVKFAVLR